MAQFNLNFGADLRQQLAGAAQSYPAQSQAMASQEGAAMDSSGGRSGGKFHKGKKSGKQPNFQISIGPKIIKKPMNIAGFQPRSRSKTLWISNPARLSREEMLAALQTQCSEPFNITEYLVNKDSILFTIDSDRALNALLRLSKKALVKGQYITISKTMKRPPGMRQCLKKETVESIERALGKRFNEGEQMLVLSELISDPELALMCPGHNVSPAFWDAAADVIARYCPNLGLLDLSSNNISTLHPLRRLFECCPHVTRLALSNNQLKSVEDLSHLRPLKKLDQLLLAGNALLTTTDRATLETRLRRCTPTITVLDGTPLQPVADQLLPAVGPSFVPLVVAPILEAFGTKYFATFDNDRFRLINVYDENSCFSISVSMGVNLRNAPELKHQSRDLLARLGRQKLAVGSSEIMKIFAKLPSTSHDLQSLTVDVWRLTDVDICVNIMGTLSEDFAFHRTFTLTPATPDSAALKQGWQVIILSDQLTLLPRNKSVGPTSHIAAAAIAAAHQN